MITYNQNYIVPLTLPLPSPNTSSRNPLVLRPHSHQGSQVIQMPYQDQESSLNRSKIYSYQQHNNDSQMKHQHPHPSLRNLNLEKQKDKKSDPRHKQSNGIMNQPPQYLPSKYTFKNDSSLNLQQQTCFFGSCCSIIRQTKREVYLSPTQLISTGYFYKSLKSQPKSLKFQNLSKSASLAQNSFFRHTSKVHQ